VEERVIEHLLWLLLLSLLLLLSFLLLLLLLLEERISQDRQKKPKKTDRLQELSVGLNIVANSSFAEGAASHLLGEVSWVILKVSALVHLLHKKPNI
jgi:hypothetical protein